MAQQNHEVRLDDGRVVLFSYDTPVAMCHPVHGWVKRDEYFSKTTSKHVNQWLRGVTFVLVGRERFLELCKPLCGGR